MERCQIPYKLETLDWNIQLNDDEEWCFMLNRMDYLNYLVLSDHIEYAKTLILNWIETRAKHKNTRYRHSFNELL